MAVPSTGRSRTARPAITSAARRPCRLAVLASGTSVADPSTASTFSTASPTAKTAGSRAAQLVVDEDAAARTHGEPGGLGQGGLGAHTDGGDDQVGRDGLAAGQRDVVGPDGGDARAKAQVDAVGADAVVHRGDHLRVQGGHHLVGRLHEGDLHAEVHEVLGDLDPDEAAADDHGGAGAEGGGDQGIGVLDVTQRQGALDAGDRRAHRVGTGGQHQGVVGQLEQLVDDEVAHHEHPAVAVDAYGLGVHTHVEAEATVQGRGRLQQQRRALLDDAPHVVGQAAVRVGDVATALDDGDLGVLEQSAQPGGRAHASGDASDDDDPHGTQHTPWGMFLDTDPHHEEFPACAEQ